MSFDNGEVTQLLDAWSGGDAKALERLIPLVVGDLRRMARAYLAREGGGHTLEPTALVNELYLRLVGRRQVRWESRTQFFATVAALMRRILVDHARHKKSAKGGGEAIRLPFNDAIGLKAPEDLDLLALDDSLKGLAEIDPRQSRIVELRFFGGLTIDETSATLDISPTTVKREWRTARLWLLRELSRP